ncbi:MAG TPA: ATP-binding protein, partial [Euzebyales bacterium]|nr:ATP-binding protein [Euzebyales bacterium]
MLYGRTEECAAVNRLIGEARAGRSAALVIRGEAGLGKSALLHHAVAQATDMTVLQASGVEAELELSFAAIHQLLQPVVMHTFGLPAPQARALRTALGLETGEHDRFLVSAALLSLLADVADRQPLLVTIDDAQWLDRASAEALVFTARRLHAEGIGILFAARDGERRRFDAEGIADVHLAALDGEAAAALLDGTLTTEAPPHVREQLIARTDGNPLALLELPNLLTPAQLEGRATLPDPLPVSAGVERAFLHRVGSLPSATRTLLLVAALADLGETDVVLRAGAALGYDAKALVDAEAAGLVVTDRGELRFRHPLIRSAIYNGASGRQRRAAHAALAEAFDHHADLDRRAWHRAASTVGHDRDVADELEQSAQRARERSGYAASAAALERAADLTVEPQRAAERLIAAADAAWNAGQLERVDALLDRAAPLVRDPGITADIRLLRGTWERTAGTMGRAYDILAHGAEQVAGVDAQRAVAMLTGAGLAAWAGNDHQHLRAAADRIVELGFDPATPAGMAAGMIRAFASIVTDDAAEATAPITHAMRAAERSGG